MSSTDIFKPIKKARRDALLNWRNVWGWSTDKKYILFESDDWGSIRTASPEAYQALLKAGDQIDKDPFTRYDAIASEDDLELLFGILSSFKDARGNHPILTANCAVANPDFNKIIETQFTQYFYEPFTETLKKYAKHSNCITLWKSGMKEGVFFPQLHCREHVNITKWLYDLQKNESDKSLRLAFEHNMISGGNAFSKDNIFAYMDAFHYYGSEYDGLLETIVSDATNLFIDTFGYESKSFVASCYVWSSSLERVLALHDIKYIQGDPHQLIPTARGYGQFDKKNRIVGEKNNYNQVSLVRNCEFEPSLTSSGAFAVDSCLQQIKTAFRWKKPATICTHRLNYVGYIDESNRDRNLPLLQQLLTEIRRCWPDAEFITSTGLGEIMAQDERNK